MFWKKCRLLKGIFHFIFQRNIVKCVLSLNIKLNPFPFEELLLYKQFYEIIFLCLKLFHWDFNNSLIKIEALYLYKWIQTSNLRVLPIQTFNTVCRFAAWNLSCLLPFPLNGMSGRDLPIWILLICLWNECVSSFSFSGSTAIFCKKILHSIFFGQ